MEPQLEGCGKRHLRGKHRRPHRASMEPQLEGCGKLKAGSKRARRSARLQWSRNLRVAERSRQGAYHQSPVRFNGAAT